MATVQFLTEKGNPSVAVRAQIKEQVVNHLIAQIEGLQETEKGLALEVATDVSGKPIYMVINPVITMSLEVPERKTRSKAKTQIEVPDLF